MTSLTTATTTHDTAVQITRFRQLPTSLRNTLFRRGVTTVGVLALCTEAEVKMWRKIGPASCEALENILLAHKLSYRKAQEPMLDKARRLYPDTRKVPVGALVQLPTLDQSSRQNIVSSDYARHTLGDFAHLSEGQLAQLIGRNRGYQGVRTQTIINDQVTEITTFLTALGLRLAN